MSVMVSGAVSINSKDRIVVIGDKVIPFHEKMTGNNMTTINGKCYIDGFELINGNWKRTFRALWYKLIN
jgi:hypothetical protein